MCFEELLDHLPAVDLSLHVSFGLPSPQHWEAEETVEGRGAEGSKRRLQKVSRSSVANTLKIVFPVMLQCVHHGLHEALAVPVEVVLRRHKEDPPLGLLDGNQAVLVLLGQRVSGGLLDHPGARLGEDHFARVETYRRENAAFLVVERKTHIRAAAVDPDDRFDARDKRGECESDISSFRSRYHTHSLTAHLGKQKDRFDRVGYIREHEFEAALEVN